MCTVLYTHGVAAMKASLRPARRTGDQSRSIMIVVTLLLSVLFCITCQGDPSMKAQTLRRAAVAGSWYPGTRAALEREITAFLEHAPLVRSGAVVRALIAPHAGYAYSGRCAGASFKQLAGQRVERVFFNRSVALRRLQRRCVHLGGRIRNAFGADPVGPARARCVACASPRSGSTART